MDDKKRLAVLVGALTGIFFSISIYLLLSFKNYQSFLEITGGLIFLAALYLLPKLKANYLWHFGASYSLTILILVNKNMSKPLFYILLFSLAFCLYAVFFASEKRKIIMKAIAEGKYKDTVSKPSFWEILIPMVLAWPLSILTVGVIYYFVSLALPSTIFNNYKDILVLAILGFLALYFILVFNLVRKLKNKSKT